MARARKIHFLGVGGVGMAGVARLLKARGDDVSGCDLAASPRTRWLEAAGIPFSAGHDPAHLAGTDLVVVTPAVPEANAELAEARRRGIPVSRRGEVLAALVNESRGVAVCGTHGKTTTSTFTTRLLARLGLRPGWCIGGETRSLGGVASAPPADGLLVVEADESDGTLALYRPEVLVLNAVDLDHLEHFKNIEAYFDCYRKAVAATRGTVIVCRDHAAAFKIATEAARVPVRSFGLDPAADVRATREQLAGASSTFVLEADGHLAPVTIPVAGRHNILNALAAAAAALALGQNFDAVAAALPAACSELPDRRFETLAEAGGVKVVTDYAHHPAELRRAVDMALLAKPGRLRVLFQPHRYTRTRALGPEFPAAFEGADEIVLIPVYAAFEKPLAGGDIADLYKRFRDAGANVLLARNAAEAWTHVRLTAAAGDLVLVAGAGDIIGLAPAIRKDLAPGWTPRDGSRDVSLAPFSFFGCGGRTTGKIVEGARPEVFARPGQTRPEILGAGSNRWFSDLTTETRYARLPRGGAVRFEGGGAVAPAGLAGAELLAALAQAGKGGLGFLVDVPGTVGGWAASNAGAFGHAFGERVESIRELRPDGKETIIPGVDCGFAYRTCRAAAEGVILDVRLRVADRPDDPAELDGFRTKRIHPAGLRTCGSVFRNPPGDAAGRLLEAAGAKALAVGGARVWERHANVIVAGPDARSSDILALARLMAAAVREQFGIELVPEIRGLDVKG